MNPQLRALAAEVLSRVSGNRPPLGRPQLLGCLENLCLLRSAEGLQEVPVAELPADLDLAPLIDHTLLKAAARTEDVDLLCTEALAHEFASVCVNPYWVPHCARRLEGSVVRVCTVVGFPLGANTTRIKAEEAREAVANGAREVDMVLAVGLAKAGQWDLVRRDFRTVREAVPEAILKVILETCLLSDEEKIKACQIAAEEGLDFVKTSTGFSTGGATEADIRLMRGTVGARSGVKASGGVRTYAEALGMALAGATRLGLSSSLVVIQGGTAVGSGY
ncbi:MAG: deoxyribose-phosphate aldolase [Holophaga sp.]|nr:deoxyribose-phosphate aldolase [Holophaga sp.]